MEKFIITVETLSTSDYGDRECRHVDKVGIIEADCLWSAMKKAKVIAKKEMAWSSEKKEIFWGHGSVIIQKEFDGYPSYEDYGVEVSLRRLNKTAEDDILWAEE